MSDEKAETFMRSFLGKVIETFCISKKLNVHVTPEWVEENRWVPRNFMFEIMRFARPLIEELMKDVSRLTAMLYASDSFLKRFVHSVCLKLIEGEQDDQIAFLKVTAFFLILTTSVFIFKCYRAIYELPSLYYKMLKDHLRTRFYNENKFEDMALKSKELLGNQEWISQTVGKMRESVTKALIVELPATRIYRDSFQHTIYRLSLFDISKEKSNNSETVGCKYCGLKCFSSLEAFFLQREMRKPNIPQK